MLRSGHNTVHVIWTAEGAVKGWSGSEEKRDFQQGRELTEEAQAGRRKNPQHLSIQRRQARVSCTEYDGTPGLRPDRLGVVIAKVYGTAIKQGGTADIVYSSLAETDGVSARFFYSGRQPDRLCGSDASKQAAGSRSDAAESGRLK